MKANGVIYKDIVTAIYHTALEVSEGGTFYTNILDDAYARIKGFGEKREHRSRGGVHKYTGEDFHNYI